MQIVAQLNEKNEYYIIIFWVKKSTNTILDLEYTNIRRKVQSAYMNIGIPGKKIENLEIRYIQTWWNKAAERWVERCWSRLETMTEEADIEHRKSKKLRRRRPVQQSMSALQVMAVILINLI